MQALPSLEQLLAELGPLPEADREAVRRLYGPWSRCVQQAEPSLAGFEDLDGIEVGRALAARVPGTSLRADGGYRRARRRRLLFFPTFWPDERLRVPLAVLEVELKSAAEPGTTPAAALGRAPAPSSAPTPASTAAPPGPEGGDPAERWRRALLEAGLLAEAIGDILLTPQGFQAVVAPEPAQEAAGRLQRLGPWRVQAKLRDLSFLAAPLERVKAIETTVASDRLDAMAAAGFSTSRNAMAKMVRLGEVTVNGRPVLQPSHKVEAGDRIGAGERGRVVVEALGAPTRKGRIPVVLRREFL